MNRNRWIGTIAAVGFAATVILANWLTTSFGFVSVGFGLTATAGTFVAGAALALRDVMQDGIGKVGTLAAIMVATAVSFWVADPFIAAASALAFLLSELADFAVYTPLRKRARLGGRRWTGAVVSSNLVGAVVDTAVFLGIAFGVAAIIPALPGQMVGKAYATVLFLVIGWGVGRAVLREPQHAGRA